MPGSAQYLIEKIRAFPPERLAELEGFIDFLAGKARRQAAMGRLLAIAPALEVAGAPRSPSKKSPPRSKPCVHHDESVAAMRSDPSRSKADRPSVAERGKATIGRPVGNAVVQVGGLKPTLPLAGGGVADVVLPRVGG